MLSFTKESYPTFFWEQESSSRQNPFLCSNDPPITDKRGESISIGKTLAEFKSFIDPFGLLAAPPPLPLALNPSRRLNGFYLWQAYGLNSLIASSSLQT